MSVALSELLGGERLNLPLEQPDHDEMFIQWVIKQADRRTATREKFEQTPEAAITALQAARVNELHVITPKDNNHYGARVVGRIKMVGDDEFWRDQLWRHAPEGLLDAAMLEVAHDYEDFLQELQWQREGFAAKKRGLEIRRDPGEQDRTGFFILDNAAFPVTAMGINEHPFIGSVDFLPLDGDFSIRRLVHWSQEKNIPTKQECFTDMLTYARRFGELVDQNPTSATVKI